MESVNSTAFSLTIASALLAMTNFVKSVMAFIAAIVVGTTIGILFIVNKLLYERSQFTVVLIYNN